MADPQAYLKDVVNSGTPESVAKREVETGDSVLLQPVDTVAVNRCSGRTIRRGHGNKTTPDRGAGRLHAG